MALPTRDDLKLYLKVETTAEDTLLTHILARAGALVRQYLDRPIEAVAKTYVDRAETHRAWGAPRRLLIPDTPVKLTSPAPVITDGESTTVDATTYTVDGETGEVLGTPGVTFPSGPYTIAATVGLDLAADYATRIEPLIGAAIIDAAADFYQHRNPAAKSEAAGGGVSVSYGESGLPARVEADLNLLRRVRGA